MSRYKLWWDIHGTGNSGSIEPDEAREIERDSIEKAVKEFAEFIADDKEGSFQFAYTDDYGFETIWVYEIGIPGTPQKFHVHRELQVTYTIERG